MPIEIDDQSIRIIGNNVVALEFYDDARNLRQTIYLQGDNTLNIGDTESGGGEGASLETHALDGPSHVGTLGNAQGPQFLLTDGSRDLTGNLDVDASVTIDGVDISAHAADANAHHTSFTAADHTAIGNSSPHHEPVTAGDGIDVTGQQVAVDVTDFIDTSYGLVENANNIRVSLQASGGLDFYGGAIGMDVSDFAGTGLEDDGAENLRIAASAAGDGLQGGGGSALAVDVSDFAGAGLEDDGSENLRIAASAAGDGLTGGSGSALAVDLATNSGLTLAGGELAMGTPTTLTVSTSNSVTTSTHSHAVTTSSNPGAAASILASDAGGGLQLVDLTLTGDLDVSRVDSHVIPKTTDTYDLGSSTLLWRKGWLSELEAILFVENTVQLLGGWFIVAHDAGTLAADAADSDTTIDFGKAMTPGDFVLFRSSLQVEYMTVGSLVSGTEYNVTRDLDGSGADEWVSGQPFLVLGSSGDGRIELNAYDTPRIQLIQQGAVYDEQTELIRIGDLNGGWGYSSETWGIAIGEYASGHANVVIDEDGAFSMSLHTVERIGLSAAGVLTIKDSGGAAVFTFDASAGAEFTKPLTLGTAGGIYQGTGTFASPTTGLKMWNDSGYGRIGGYNAGTIQWYADTDGKLYAGAGDVILDADGISIAIGADPGDAENSIKWMNGATEEVVIVSYVAASSANLLMTAGVSEDESDITLEASAISSFTVDADTVTDIVRAYVTFYGSYNVLVMYSDDPSGTDGYSLFENYPVRIADSLNVGSNADPDYTLDVAGTAGFDEYLYHNGDADTYQHFQDDRWTLTCGGTTMIDVVESTTDYVVIGARLGIGRTPTVLFDVYQATGNTIVNIESDGADSTPQIRLVNDVVDWRIENQGYSDDKLGFRDVTNGTYPLRIEPAAPTDTLYLESAGNVGIGTAAQFGSGAGVIGIADAGTNPSSNPSGGGVLYSDSGAGKWRGSGGTTTTFGPAEPHCPTCGRDFVVEWTNEAYGHLLVCMWCLTQPERPGQMYRGVIERTNMWREVK